MKEMMKRGQGEVVTSVLLVLLVLAAIAIITPFLLGFLQKGAQSVTAACLQLDLQPVGCAKVHSTNVSVTYKWAGGEVNLTGIKLIVYKTDKTSSVVDGKLLNQLETGTSEIDVGGLGSEFTVAGVVVTEGGGEITCNENPNKVVCS